MNHSYINVVFSTMSFELNGSEAMLWLAIVVCGIAYLCSMCTLPDAPTSPKMPQKTAEPKTSSISPFAHRAKEWAPNVYAFRPEYIQTNGRRTFVFFPSKTVQNAGESGDLLLYIVYYAVVNGCKIYYTVLHCNILIKLYYTVVYCIKLYFNFI